MTSRYVPQRDGQDATPQTSERLLFTVDLAGIFLFAIEGAGAAIRGGLDLFGVLVLAFVTALVGGVIRDLLIGAIPPQAIRDWRYAATAFIAGGGTFLLYHLVQQIPPAALIALDAAGLALFAMAGAEKALDYGINPFIAVLMGTTTGVGGGTVRDILLAQIPSVLRTDIYATAAFIGAAVMVGARRTALAPSFCAFLGGMVCFLIRVVSVWQHWNLPRLTGI
jgi:uncharacterized membrane protein YeiH